MKICNKCGVNKPLNEFGIIRIQRDGHDGTCFQCRHLMWAAKLKRMPNSKIIELEKLGHKICKICNIDKPLTEYPIDRSSPDGHKTRCVYCNKIKSKEYYNNRKPKRTIYLNARKDETSKYHRESCQQFKALIMAHYGDGKCACVKCGENRLPCLTIDHINGGGNKHRRENHTHTGLHFYKWLIHNNYPTGYRTLCWNCQFIVEDERRNNKRSGF